MCRHLIEKVSDCSPGDHLFFEHATGGSGRLWVLTVTYCMLSVTKCTQVYQVVSASFYFKRSDAL